MGHQDERIRKTQRAAVRGFLLLIALDSSAQPGRGEFGARIAKAAELQVGVTRFYDPAYVSVPYPGGDVPRDRGVCTDVVVRAFRSVGVDLQKEVHEDMRQNFRSYPRNWGLSRPDRNIDHRRVPNLMTWFTRKGRSVAAGEGVVAGDIVAWKLPGGLLHIGVASGDRVPGTRRPLMVHNIGAGAQKEDILNVYEVIGHYRW